MQKLASEFSKTTIITKQERAILGFLKNVVINPENGDVVGILFRVPGRKDKAMVANARNIAGIGANFLMLNSVDSASPPNEIIRIKEILDLNIELVGSKVVDEDGRHLGKVRNFSVNLKTMRLERLYAASSSLVKLLAQDLIIPSSDIIKIEKDKVTVRSGTVKSGKKMSSLIKTNKPIRAETVQMKIIDK